LTPLWPLLQQLLASIEYRKITVTLTYKNMLLQTLILVILLTTVNCEMDYTCTPGQESSPGVSLPRGDISQAVGGPSLTLTCHLNPAHPYYAALGLRAKHLSFWSPGSGTLSSAVVNDTTIRNVEGYIKGTLSKF
jgi:hypothetical protein